MAMFLRMALGVLALPACAGLAAAFPCAIGDGAASRPEIYALLGGMAAFILCWFFLPHPVKTYVFAHEMTHALWGLAFGARPSRMRVGDDGGSVRLTKTNLLITLAPYFFPFYAFLVALAAFAVWLFVRPLPAPWAWVAAIGFAWAFHAVFTFDSLAQTQPDVAIYGRIFSWTFIFIANAVLVMAFLAAATGRGQLEVAARVADSVAASYAWTFRRAAGLVQWTRSLFACAAPLAP